MKQTICPGCGKPWLPLGDSKPQVYVCLHKFECSEPHPKSVDLASSLSA